MWLMQEEESEFVIHCFVNNKTETKSNQTVKITYLYINNMFHQVDVAYFMDNYNSWG
jgi:hypothetical protein